MIEVADISAELRAYLADWLAWVERGAPEGKPYTRRFGLCFNTPRPGDVRVELKRLLYSQFGEGCGAPFGGGKRYWNDIVNNTKHENPERLAWVRRTLGVEP